MRRRFTVVLPVKLLLLPVIVELVCAELEQCAVPTQGAVIGQVVGVVQSQSAVDQYVADDGAGRACVAKL